MKFKPRDLDLLTSGSVPSSTPDADLRRAIAAPIAATGAAPRRGSPPGEALPSLPRGKQAPLRVSSGGSSDVSKTVLPDQDPTTTPMWIA